MSGKDKNIEAIYPLSPMQQGMLFHSLYSPQTGVYFVQLSCTIRGDFDTAAFESAWSRVIERHPALRTLFVWERHDKPLQVVRQQVKTPWTQHDWRALTAHEQQTQLTTFLEADRARNFDLGKAPLMRLALLRVADDRWHFVWSFHHLLLDGWSLSLVLKEVFMFYEAAHAGDELVLDQPQPFREYIAWLERQDLAAAEQFWRRTLTGFSAATPLVMGRSLSAEPIESYAEQTIQLSETTTAALQALARRHQLTLNTLVQGAWALLLQRYSGERDIVFGTTVSGRPADLLGVEEMVGLFINTLPVRIRIPADAEVLPWLEAIQAEQFEQRQYEYTPLAQIQGWSEVERGQPLFESLVVFENYPVDQAVSQDAVTTEIDTMRIAERTNYPLNVTAIPGSELSLRIRFDTRRFEATTIERMLGHFATLLTAIATQPGRRLSELPLLTDAEQQQILVGWNTTTTQPVPDLCFHEVFAAQAASSPAALAVVAAGQQLTYAELNARSNQLAHYLQALGVGPDVCVGLCLERSVELIVGLLGILKAGGAYVPLDPNYPTERLALVLSDGGIDVLLTQRDLVAHMPGSSARIVCLDSDWPQIATQPETTPVSGVKPEHLAYVIYTSGSTGRPKGVQIQHRGLLNLTLTLNESIYARHADRPLRVGLNAPLAFDASVKQLIALLYGHTLYIIPQDARLDGAALLAFLRQHRLDLVDCVPVQLRLLLAAGLLDQTGWTPAAMLPSGEAIDRELWSRLAQVPRPLFYNMYGPTECTVDVTACCVQESPEQPSIGRPLANMQTYILDEQMQPVPVGVPGELYVGGMGLARGYRHRPDLTAEKFIPSPFDATGGARLYRTGDRVRYTADGRIEFLDRVDFQVKLRGFRIELGDIEATLARHPAVREVVAIVREDAPPAGGQPDKRLVAYIVSATAAPPTVGELREYLQQQLPEYMIPAAFVFLAQLPLTPNGKVDRKQLPAPETSRPELGSDYAAPRTPVEQTLAEIWSGILRVERVGIHDDFFALGGDSILCFQVISRAARAGLRLSPRQVFQHPTIAKLAPLLEQSSTILAEQEPVEGPVLLTPIQQRFFEQRQPEPHHYNQAVLLTVQQPIDQALAEQILSQLTRHHDALRMRFTCDDTGWHQISAGLDSETSVTAVDLRGLPATEQAARIEQAATELQASLDLAQGPLLRAALFNLGPDQPARILIAIHHLVVDGVSWRVLLEDFQTLYQQISTGQAVQLPPKTTSFRQWADRLHSYAQTATLRAQLPYWLSTLRAPIRPLPVDLPGGENTVASAETIEVALTADETRALLQDLPSVYRTQINDVLLTALGLALAQWTGTRALLVDLEGHGREDLFEDVDLSRTVGWFTSLSPILLDLRQAAAPIDALKVIKEQLRRVPQHGIGYGLLRYLSTDAAIGDALQSAPHAEIVFNYLGQIDQALPSTGILGLADESSGLSVSAQGRRSHLIAINGSVVAEQLRLHWTYSAQIHQRATIQRVADACIDALRALITHARTGDVSGFTPLDFPKARVNQKDLDKLMQKLKTTR